MRVLGISGSLRVGSLNTALLQLVESRLEDSDELVLFEGLGDVPPYNADRESPLPEAVARLRDTVAGADAVLFASPEYNGSIPGQLKNALDWISREVAGAPLRGKAVAVIGASPGQFGGVWAQAELRKVLGVMGAKVVPTELGVARADTTIPTPDGELLGALAGVLGELKSLAGESVAVARSA